ncbi:MAG: hypothetical protein M1828_002313 [Chrysothrix sp. TS-e1954]|nr:MAG: hypothetical protein M1828_002313 [Chrysothrix sp. TS-e1954]
MDGFSSIAGLLSLLGLTVQSTCALHGFCSRYKSSNRDVADLTSDVFALQNALRQLETLPLRMCQASTVGTLQYHVSKCKSDLDEWLAKLSHLDPDQKKGVAKIGKKIAASIGHHQFAELRSKVAAHRGQLSMLLQFVGRDLDLENHRQISDLGQLEIANHRESMATVNSLAAGVEDLRLTTGSLCQIDSRLREIQEHIMSSMSQTSLSSRRTARAAPKVLRRSRRTISATSASKGADDQLTMTARTRTESSRQVMRLVKTAVVLQESDGNISVDLLATEDQTFKNARHASKLAMIQYLQGLRLLIWLLRRDNLTSACWQLPSTCQSLLRPVSSALYHSHRRKVLDSWLEADRDRLFVDYTNLRLIRGLRSLGDLGPYDQVDDFIFDNLRWIYFVLIVPRGGIGSLRDQWWFCGWLLGRITQLSEGRELQNLVAAMRAMPFVRPRTPWWEALRWPVP